MLLRKLLNLSFVTILFLTMIMSGCKQSVEKKTEYESVDQKVEKAGKEQSFVNLFDSTSNSIPVFYNMYLTVEMSSFFEETGVAFQREMLNEAENIENYLTSYKKALNIGIYAVDLSYVKVFNEFDLAGKYFSAMHKLSEGLGIPDDFFYGAAKRFERNISNKDSLAFIANEIYNITDNHLKENNRENTASLIIVGGWIEAMNLALQIYSQSNENMEVLDKIADQKNSLIQIISLVDLSQDRNEYIVGVMNDIKDLIKPFNKLSEVYASPAKAKPIVDELRKRTSLIRKEMTN